MASLAILVFLVTSTLASALDGVCKAGDEACQADYPCQSWCELAIPIHGKDRHCHPGDMKDICGGCQYCRSYASPNAPTAPLTSAHTNSAGEEISTKKIGLQPTEQADFTQQGKEPLVLLLPCGGGFPKESVAESLENLGIRVQLFGFSTSQERDNIMKRTVDAISSYDGPVILHGWSFGGGLALRVAREHGHRLPNLKAIALFAAAESGWDLSGINLPMIFFHNSRDSVIDVSSSKENVRSANKGKSDPVAELKISNDFLGHRSNHHQCDEFHDDAVKWITKHARRSALTVDPDSEPARFTPTPPTRPTPQVSGGAWNACRPGAKACCDPTTTPAQICPGGQKCQACGGSKACECPTDSGSAPTTPTPPTRPTPQVSGAAWSVCRPGAKACCDPTTTPAQICPGGQKCQACGGSKACECPSN